MKEIIHQIYDHPGISGTIGSAMACTFSMINIPATTEMLELAGAIVKDIGILAGSTVAVASLVSYIAKNWLKKANTTNEPPKKNNTK